MRAFWRALVGVYEHGAIGFSKGAAYSALLALFPVLTTVTTLLVNANAEAVSHKVTETLFRVVPPGAEEVVRAFITVRGNKPKTLPVVASILSLWAASGVMMSLMEGFQAALGKPSSRGIVRQRLMAMWLVVIGILPVVGASVAMLFGERGELTVMRWLGFLQADESLLGGIQLLTRVMRFTLILLTVYSVTALFYFFGPAVPRRGRPIVPGAVLSTVLWLGTTAVFAWYVRNIASYNVLYGSIGAVIALIVWMYLLAMISLLGFEYNVALSGGKAKR